jgi:hypothetical protein
MRLPEESFDSARQTQWDTAGEHFVKVGQAVRRAISTRNSLSLCMSMLVSV